jgi:DNA-binding response OmpR family regulator
VRLDRGTRQVTRDGIPIQLTRREFELLELLLQRPRQVFSREQILDRVWGWEFVGDTNVVEVHIGALRTKLGDRERKLIRTVRGVGYSIGG